MLKVIDLQGRKILERTLGADVKAVELDVSMLNSGFYIVQQIVNDHLLANGKLIKQ